MSDERPHRQVRWQKRKRSGEKNGEIKKNGRKTWEDSFNCTPPNEMSPLVGELLRFLHSLFSATYLQRLKQHILIIILIFIELKSGWWMRRQGIIWKHRYVNSCSSLLPAHKLWLSVGFYKVQVLTLTAMLLFFFKRPSTVLFRAIIRLTQRPCPLSERWQPSCCSATEYPALSLVYTTHNLPLTVNRHGPKCMERM